MAITIHSNYVSPQSGLTEKFNNIYKKNVDEKVAVLKNSTSSETAKIRQMSNNDIREYLTADEKKVLKEVFGDVNVDKNTATPYSNSRYAEFLKGTQLDVKL